MAVAEKRQAFITEHTVYFNETNAMGGVAYFSNYIKWQGMAREDYFIKSVPTWRDIMKLISLGQLNMITVEEHSHFIKHAYFGDELLIKLFTHNVKKYSFEMLFFMFKKDGNELLYQGFQKLAFDNFRGSFVEIPQPMLVSINAHRIDDDSEDLIRLKTFWSNI